MIDLHMHILAGLDDGPQQWDEALAMGEAAAADGTTTVVATPHMYNGVHNVTREQILAGTDRLRQELGKRGIPLAVEPGADVHIRPDLCELVLAQRVVTVGDRGKYLMVELPPDQLPMGVEQLLFDLQLQGVTPMLSHPERNMQVQADPALLLPFVQAGNLSQLTTSSLIGDFGRRAAQCAHTLLECRLAHVVASDAHGWQKRAPGLSEARRLVEKVLPAQEAEDMFEHRPAAILAGQYVELPDPMRPRSSKRRGWFS